MCVWVFFHVVMMRFLLKQDVGLCRVFYFLEMMNATGISVTGKEEG